ncbi:MAG: ketoacyl-ACP synthase III [Lachnospiraceae bacterium]|nr:ketoacyl-ACP synthase III [Lachnospiraceae bacterium]
MTIRIKGTGSALPERVLTNSELEKMVDTSDEWIRERTGIRERRISSGDTVASLASAACMNALESAGKTAEDVELILVATCSPELLLPCCACQVQNTIGAQNAVAFDLNAACSGFLFALDTAYAYITAGIYKNALVVGSEVLSKLVDWNDRSTCVLFGDGAGAVYVEGTKDEDSGIVSIVQDSNGAKGMVLYCNDRSADCKVQEEACDTFIHMDGREVYKFATRQVPECIERALEKASLNVDDIDIFILHQANIRILEAIAKHLKADISRFPVNLDHVGNMSSAAIPVLLDELNKNNKIKKGQRIVLSGFGAGLTSGACVMIW